MRKRGKVKIVLTVFIIVLFSCTAVIGNSRTGVIENVMAKNAADVDIPFSYVLFASQLLLLHKLNQNKFDQSYSTFDFHT